MTTADSAASSPDSSTVTLPTPGRVPIAIASSRYIGVILALIVLTAGVVVLRDCAIQFGWLAGTSWTGAVVAAADGLRSHWWMIPVGCIGVVVGGAMIVSALRPRRKTAVAVTAAGAVWMRPRDVARLVAHAADSVPGVEVLRSVATRRKVTLYVGLADPQSAAQAKGTIAAAVGSATEILVPPPQITVRIGTSGAR